MKIYKTQSEVDADIKDGVLAIDGDIKFECSISIEAHIDAGDITARDIIAWDINAGDITAREINAWDINAWEINAGDISYYAFCNVYKNITCTSITARRDTAHKPVCLDGTLEIRGLEDPAEQEAIELLKKNRYKIMKSK